MGAGRRNKIVSRGDNPQRREEIGFNQFLDRTAMRSEEGASSLRMIAEGNGGGGHTPVRIIEQTAVFEAL